LCVRESLATSFQHLLADGHEFGIATIYRTLDQFVQVGLLLRNHFKAGISIFELNQGVHHDHLVCIQCGKVVEFQDEMIERRQKEIAKQNGFKMEDHTLHIYGTCQNSECQKNS
jgi:Fur family transcriptional regulator, ferric uptake regulator